MEPLIHFIIPFVALMLFGVNLRSSLLIALLALTPDVDALLLVHRSFTHSLPVVVVFVAPLLLALYRFNPNLLKYGFMGLLSVASHIALDLPTGYTPFLWPLYNYSMWIQAELAVHVGSAPTLTLDLRVLTQPIVFEVVRSLDAALFTGWGLIVSLIILLPLLARALCRRVWSSRR